LSRLTIFAKGNLDVRDALHSLRLGGALAWNGLNQVLRERSSGDVVRLRHETWTRSDALLAATGVTPASLSERALDLGAHTAAVQFSDALFSAEADAFVLSIQPDINVQLLRHRQEGYLFYPNDWRSWPQEDRDWLRANFTPEPFLDVDSAIANLAQIVGRLRSRSAAPILIFNVSSVVPGEDLHDYMGMDEPASVRIKRFNLGLIALSRQTGVSIIDVDRIVAQGGADRLKLDAGHLTAAGCEAVAREVVRVLEDYGVLTPAKDVQ